MIKKQAIIMALAATCSLAACNSSDTEYHEAELDGSAIVKGFSLVENNKILADLDSVFFSIDLVAGEIFNADSLPKDTRINGLAANEAPAGLTPQSLVLFSLAYFVGVFGFPWLAGQIIVNDGMHSLLWIILGIALCNWSITLGRLVWRHLLRDVSGFVV